MTPTENGRLEVGRVARAHGVRGDVLLTMITDRLAERMAVGSRLYVGRTAAAARDMDVTAAQAHGHYWRVHFAGVSDRNAAEALRGELVFADPIDDPDALFVHELMGAQVVDQDGVVRGVVTGVLDNPAALILEVDDEHLVPMNFLESFDAGVITVNVPIGIFHDDEIEPPRSMSDDPDARTADDGAADLAAVDDADSTGPADRR